MSQSLQEALRTFALLANLDAEQLIAFADEDTIGGYPGDWSVGSVWEVEGKFLYAVARALKATRILEIGCHHGCSTSHLLLAAALNDGTVTSLDINPNAGGGIPEMLRDRWEFIPTDAEYWAAATDREFDLVFEDGPHSTGFTESVLRCLRGTPAIIGHDSEHALVGEAVSNAWRHVFGGHGYTSVLIAPSDCGLAYRVNR